MLHILLCILKIIGLILALIIGIVVFIIAAVLLAALRYEIKAKLSRDVKLLDIDMKFSWLLRIVSGYVVYRDQKLDWRIKIAWKELNSVKEETISPEIEVEEIVGDVKEDTTELAKKITSDVVNDVKKDISGNKACNESEKQDRAAANKVKDSKKPKKSLEEKIQYSIQNISDKIKAVLELKDKILSYIQDENHKKAFQKVLKELRRMLKKIKPKKLQGNVEFGFEDPYITGRVLAFASIFFPFYGECISIKPNFEENVLDGDLYLKGKIKISYFVTMGIRIILSKNVRNTIQDTMKMISKK